MRIERHVPTRVDRLERDEPQALASGAALPELPPRPERDQPRPCRQEDLPGADGVPGVQPPALPGKREVPGVGAARDPDPAGVARPFIAAERPLAALKAAVGGGPEPGSAVGIDPNERSLPVVPVESGIAAMPPRMRFQMRSDPASAVFESG